jgi:Dolichyl-phosphate-mannose-protein mannosyltransferase
VRRAPVAALVAIYAASVLVYALVAHEHRFPNLFPDEMFYGKLSQSFADGDGLKWHGADLGLPPLWPVVLSLAWHFGSVPDGYGVARVLTALLASAVVFPVWLLAREFVGPRLALVPAVLSVVGAWMTVTSYLVSENLAYPLATAALACTVMAVRDTRTRWLGWTMFFALLAALTRTQLLALPVILLVALLLDVARQPRDRRRARIDERPRALWIGLAVLVAGGLLAFVAKPDLTNYEVLAHHASVGEVLKTVGRHGASTIVMLAFIPVAAVAALMARASNWRNDDVGPLLVTITAAVLVLLPVLGRFEAWATHGQPVDRYAMYLAPLFLVAMMLVPGRIGKPAAVIAAVAVAGAALAAPITGNYIEQPALYGTQKRLFELGFFDRHLHVGVALAALALGLGGVLLLASRTWVTTAVLLTASVMVAQAWTSQHAEITVEKNAEAAALPKPLDWVDRAAAGPVGVFAVGAGQALRGNRDLYTEFFNRKVKYSFATEPIGAECRFTIAPDGRLRQADGDCPPWLREYVLVARPARPVFYDQHVLARTNRGTLVRIPTEDPRLRSW